MAITPLKEQTSNYNVSKDGIIPGGRLSRFLESWKRMTHHPWPISVLQHGYKLQFTKTPIPWKSRPMKISTMEQTAINEAVSKFLQAGIIEKSQTQKKIESKGYKVVRLPAYHYAALCYQI